MFPKECKTVMWHCKTRRILQKRRTVEIAVLLSYSLRFTQALALEIKIYFF
jgi:hypothetical protein